ncbi:MAG: hypothetical protein ACYCVV_20795 [Acidimicrobiales bacterium]
MSSDVGTVVVIEDDAALEEDRNGKSHQEGGSVGWSVLRCGAVPVEFLSDEGVELQVRRLSLLGPGSNTSTPVLPSSALPSSASRLWPLRSSPLSEPALRARAGPVLGGFLPPDAAGSGSLRHDLSCECPPARPDPLVESGLPVSDPSGSTGSPIHYR